MNDEERKKINYSLKMLREEINRINNISGHYCIKINCIKMNIKTMQLLKSDMDGLYRYTGGCTLFGIKAKIDPSLDDYRFIVETGIGY